MKAWMSSNFDQIPLLSVKVAAPERLNIHVYCCEHYSAFIFDWMFFILAGNEDIHRSLDDFE